MNILQLQTLIILEESRRPRTINLLKKYTTATNNIAHLRLNISRLVNNHNIKRVNPVTRKTVQKQPKLGDGKFLPSHYEITRRGIKYLEYQLEQIQKNIKEKYKEYYKIKEIKPLIMEERIELFWKKKKLEIKI